jgi:hypothetical protein
VSNSCALPSAAMEARHARGRRKSRKRRAKGRLAHFVRRGKMYRRALPWRVAGRDE